MPTSPLPLPVSFPPGRGSAKGRNDLVEKPVLEDGLELPVTISVWRESVSKNVSETGRRGRGAGASSSADDGAAPSTAASGGGGAASGEGEGRSDSDLVVGGASSRSHKGSQAQA